MIIFWTIIKCIMRGLLERRDMQILTLVFYTIGRLLWRRKNRESLHEILLFLKSGKCAFLLLWKVQCENEIFFFNSWNGRISQERKPTVLIERNGDALLLEARILTGLSWIDRWWQIIALYETNEWEILSWVDKKNFVENIISLRTKCHYQSFK